MRRRRKRMAPPASDPASGADRMDGNPMIPMIDVTSTAPRKTQGRFPAGRLAAGDIVLDLNRYRVHRAGRPVALGTREFRILALLMRHPGHVYTRDQILDRVWGEDADVTDRNVDAYIKRLRRMLNGGGRADPIRTVRGVGYAFDEYYGHRLS